MPGGDRAFTRKLALVTLAALAVRLAYVVLVRPRAGLSTPDAFLYHHGANLLADGLGYIDPYSYFYAGGTVHPAADHPPAYMLYLALFSVAGVTSPLGHMVATSLLGAGVVLLVGLVGREVAGPRVGLLAAVLAAAYPELVVADGSLQSESMAALAVTGVVLAALRFRRRPTLARAVEIGLLLGWAGMTRPEQYLLGLVVVLPVVRAAAVPRRTRLSALAVAAVVCVAMAAPWVAFNLGRFEHPVLFSTNLDYTIATTNCPSTWSGELIGFWDPGCNAAALEAAGLSSISDEPSERAVVYRRAGLDHLGEHLERLPLVVGARVLRALNLWDPVGQVDLDVEVEGRERAMAVAAIPSFHAVAVLAVVGWRGLRRDRLARRVLAGPLLVVVLMAVLFMGNARYRTPAAGALCVLAGAGVHALVRRGDGPGAGSTSDDLVGAGHDEVGPGGEPAVAAPSPVGAIEVGDGVDGADRPERG